MGYNDNYYYYHSSIPYLTKGRTEVNASRLLSLEPSPLQRLEARRRKGESVSA